VTTTIDTSTLVAYLLEEGGSEAIRELLSEGVESVPLIIKESSNAVLEARRQKRISPAEGERVLQAILALSEANIKLVPQEGLIQEAFKIAMEHDLTIYDSIYIALAMRSESTLASRDKKQAAVAAKLGVKTIDT
jgi:predicted nucleic acid-binding protein